MYTDVGMRLINDTCNNPPVPNQWGDLMELWSYELHFQLRVSLLLLHFCFPLFPCSFIPLSAALHLEYLLLHTSLGHARRCAALVFTSSSQLHFIFTFLHSTSAAHTLLTPYTPYFAKSY
ncbi:hypothetical protein FPQ18DRAFT_318281 [Pyronema domesticum]|nr:hypothetical protein FPQ18DRAFT_318281 [Pyronema domesticum]